MARTTGSAGFRYIADADARAPMGDAGEWHGFAYRWNARRAAFDYVNVAPRTSMRTMQRERPQGITRERTMPRFPRRTSQRNASPTVSTGTLWTTTDARLRDVAHTQRVRALVSIGVGL